MRIKHTRTTYETLELSDSEVNDVVRQKLYRLISPGEYIRTKDNKVYLMQDDPNHRHGSISEEFVRIATELDVAVCLVLKSL